ncbi:MAG: DUF6062 family protein [Hungatella sp.]
MKDKLYTIELTDAMKSGEECPLCYLERKLEQNAIEFVLGSSYMESDMREKTDQQGFCQKHTKIMYDYGNALGNAWIWKSRLEYLRQGLEKQMDAFVPEKTSILDRWKKKESIKTGIGDWIRNEESHCYVCSRIEDTYARVLDTFTYLVKRDPDFLNLVKNCKGFCIHHFADLTDICEKKLDNKEKEILFPVLFAQMNQQLERVQGDIDWLIEKYDYLNAEKDWKNSKDALPRTMQKIVGGYPADPVFKNQK